MFNKSKQQKNKLTPANIRWAGLKKFAGFCALTVVMSSHAQAATVSAFSENFEGTLAAWTDRTPANPQAVIVADPLRAGNRVLSFTTLGSGGSIFSTDFIGTTSGAFTVSFEYLGLATAGDDDGDLGGFFGISTNFDPQSYPVDHDWVAGSGTFPAPIRLVDNNQWRTYTLTFSSRIGQPVHLIFEDFSGSGPVAGDVYFDNIRFNDAEVDPLPFPSNNVPEPHPLALFGIAGFAAAWIKSSKRRKNNGSTA